jgi:transposase
MRKIRYRAIEIKQIVLSELEAKLEGDRVVVGVDLAKHGLYAAFVNDAGEAGCIVKWKQPEENVEFISILKGLANTRKVEVVLEPSGCYGDALTQQLRNAGLPVYRVQPKRTHDAMEVYDGVPSLHDAKCATIVARLHLSGVSDLWNFDSTAQRRAKAALSEL